MQLGEIYHFRGRYLEDWGDTTEAAWRFEKAAAGSGSLGDLGAHVIDVARYLVGEIAQVAGVVQTFLPGREVDDAFEAAVAFDNGAVGTIEATRFAPGRKNTLAWEINGSKGSLAFELERLNELQVSEGKSGFRTLLVTEPGHPFMDWWWPPGQVLGWEHTFVHELEHLLGAISRPQRRRPARGHVRGRLSRGSGLRCNSRVRRQRQPAGSGVPLVGYGAGSKKRRGLPISIWSISAWPTPAASSAGRIVFETWRKSGLSSAKLGSPVMKS